MYIYVHGKMGEKEDAFSLAETATSKGFQVLSFDLPEHGQRTDKTYPNNIWDAIVDLNKIFDYAKSTWKEINLYAISIGAYYSLLAYNNVSIKQLNEDFKDMVYIVKKVELFYESKNCSTCFSSVILNILFKN